MGIISYDFSIGQTVSIKGQVDSLLTDSNGNRYRVIYWFNGERRSSWMHEWELAEV